jgi:hypothetical protein
VSIDFEAELTRPIINGEIEVLENIFLFLGHKNSSAISATVDVRNWIVDVSLNIGSECATETHRNSVI